MKREQILLVYPEFPSTYWSFHSVFKYTRARASYPPLGLMTVAAMIPDGYDLKLVDLNVEELSDDDIIASKTVFISGMLVQKESFDHTVQRCRAFDRIVVAGGPYPTSAYDSMAGVDHFILGECEDIIEGFFNDMAAGEAKKIYTSDQFPDIRKTPPPRFDLIDIKNYYSMALQFSRGCPFNCEFCDIIELFGRVPRTKTPEQMLTEFDLLYARGFSGSLFIVDDNFIGNKKHTRELLRRIIPWQKKHGYPFVLYTEASINLAEDDEMIDLMISAGFNMVFIGIETPSEESLKETGKGQNLKGNGTLLDRVRYLQEKGLEVSGGFIVGFDSDDEFIFRAQEKFIQASAIPMAMIGLLQALPSSRLYRRLRDEGRLVGKTAGNNTHDLELNFKPRMEEKILVNGYVDLLQAVYDPASYFSRVYEFLGRVKKGTFIRRKTTLSDIMIFLRFLASKTTAVEGRLYLKFLAKVMIRKPALFAEAARFAIMGEHLINITEEITRHHRFISLMESTLSVMTASAQHIREEANPSLAAPFQKYMERAARDIRKRYRSLPSKMRKRTGEDLSSFNAEMYHIMKELDSPAETFPAAAAIKGSIAAESFTAKEGSG